MNILGVGAEEVILIFILALIFLGPKRMLGWTYTAGKYFAQFRKMVDETMGAIRKEFEAAQIELPKDLSIGKGGMRFNVVDEANKFINNEVGQISPPVGGGKAGMGTMTAAAAIASNPPAPTNGSLATPTASASPASTTPVSTNSGDATGKDSANRDAKPADSSSSDENNPPRYDAWLPK